MSVGQTVGNSRITLHSAFLSGRWQSLSPSTRLRLRLLLSKTDPDRSGLFPLFSGAIAYVLYTLQGFLDADSSDVVVVLLPNDVLAGCSSSAMQICAPVIRGMAVGVQRAGRRPTPLRHVVASAYGNSPP